MKPRSYATPLAFKTAVEQRLRDEAVLGGSTDRWAAEAWAWRPGQGAD